MEPSTDDLIDLAGMNLEKKRPGFLILGPTKPLVKMTVADHPMTFMVDTGSEHSVVTPPITPFTGEEITVIGATGSQEARPFCKLHTCKLRGVFGVT